jgi:hypothetical protein
MSAPLLKEDWQALLRALPPGWDTYGAPAISESAIRTLESFAAVPMGEGGIQLEVHRDGWSIEIVIGADGRIASARLGREPK